MSSFITVSSQQGTSKTIVNVNSLNRVSYHLSSSAHKLIENYKLSGSLGLFNADDFYSVLDINGSKVNTLDSIDEIEDKLNEVSGIGHGMTYIPNTVLESSKEVLSHPEFLASYLSPFTDYLYKGKVFCGCSLDVSLAWTDEMVKSLLSLFKSCIDDLPADFSYQFSCPLEYFPTDKFEFIKGKPCVGIPLRIANQLSFEPNYGLLSSKLTSFELKYIQAERCISPRCVSDEGKGGVVGINDYNSVLVTISPFKVILPIKDLISYLVIILKDAFGVERSEKFLNDLFTMLCTVVSDDLFSYLESHSASEYTEVEGECFVSLGSYTVKGDYVYIPLKERFGRFVW